MALAIVDMVASSENKQINIGPYMTPKVVCSREVNKLEQNQIITIGATRL